MDGTQRAFGSAVIRPAFPTASYLRSPDCFHRSNTPAGGAAEAQQTSDVFPDRARDVYAAVGVLDPHDRQGANRQPGILGQDQQLGVEEPMLVLDQRQ